MMLTFCLLLTLTLRSLLSTLILFDFHYFRVSLFFFFCLNITFFFSGTNYSSERETEKEWKQTNCSGTYIIVMVSSKVTVDRRGWESRSFGRRLTAMTLKRRDATKFSSSSYCCWDCWWRRGCWFRRTMSKIVLSTNLRKQTQRVQWICN